jgi:hypothetical protein
MKRAALEALLPALVAAVTPMNTHARIRWRIAAPGSGGVDDEYDARSADDWRLFTLDEPVPRRLGDGARLGGFVLAGRRRASLKDLGIAAAFRLD